jgi:hypothetical protein
MSAKTKTAETFVAASRNAATASNRLSTAFPLDMRDPPLSRAQKYYT